MIEEYISLKLEQLDTTQIAGSASANNIPQGYNVYKKQQEMQRKQNEVNNIKVNRDKIKDQIKTQQKLKQNRDRMNRLTIMRQKRARRLSELQ